MSAEVHLRYPEVSAMLLDLQRFEDGLPVSAFRETPWQTAVRFTSRNRVLLGLLAAYLAVRFFLYFFRRLL